ncbi:MAG: tRNA lysidine(34) synthetase TilS [Bauldia sp.]|nr:tRNA lysidine(34) synthetase TilS [Bauldia sp.]
MRAAEQSQPLTAAEAEALLAPVADAGVIALAVSGGADSLALLDIVDRWRRTPGRPAVVVLTVDHRLRKGSDREAAEVVVTARERGLPAHHLTVADLPPDSDEEAARHARYRLLFGAARGEGASHLLLAHHRDDQAETFLIRLQRGSGIFGLAAMRRLVEADGITVFRPFLDIPRSRLAATTVVAGLVAVDDPMNRDPRFLRARIRQDMPRLAAAGLGPAELAAAAAQFASAADAIEASADRFIAGAVTVDELGIVRLPLRSFAAEPDAVRHRVLVRGLLAIGGEGYPPRFQRLEALDRAIRDFTGGRFKRTLAGTVAEIRGDAVLLFREEGREGLPESPVGAGFEGVWDGRFRIAVGPEEPAGLVVGALGEADRQAIRARIEGIPAAALAVQPAFRRNGRLLRVPTLGFAAEGMADHGTRVRQIVSVGLARPRQFPIYDE